MRHNTFLLALLACVALTTAANAQAYDLSWFTIDGGGGRLDNGDLSLSGTIGQPDTGSMSGGGFSLDGGFWSNPDGGGGCGSADFNCDGDVGTDLDIEAFFACIAGDCPAAPCANNSDFNGDGDIGTDADIEAFFSVLAGGAC